MGTHLVVRIEEVWLVRMKAKRSVETLLVALLEVHAAWVLDPEGVTSLDLKELWGLILGEV